MTEDDRPPEEFLVPFIAAAKEHEPILPPRRVTAIRDDAARIQRERAIAPDRRPGLLALLGRALAAPGRLGPAMALAGCAAVGFAAGLAGGGDLGSGLIWGADATIDGAVPAVEAFFDLESMEG